MSENATPDTQRRRLLAGIAAGAAAALGGQPVRGAALPNKDIGIVMMHGKWGRPPGPVAGYLEREGYRVVSPEMPWSGGRLYDVPYMEGLTALHAIVRKLRADGTRKVVVGGESFGANGTLAYQSVYGDADALIILAPEHMPGSWYRSGLIKEEVDRALALREEGKGKERYSFTDPNQDKSRRMTATVETYLSYFAPRGRGNVAVTAAKIAADGKAVPVLLVNSTNETRTQGRKLIFDVLPPHPKSVYIESGAGHGEAAERARPDVMRFLESIAQD